MKVLVLAGVICALVGCSSEDNRRSGGGSENPGNSGNIQEEGLDKPLAGKIGGDAWQLGKARMTSSDGTQFNIAMISDKVKDVCTPFLSSEDGMRVMFSMKKPEIKVGKITLSMERGVTLMRMAGSAGENYAVTEGFIDITSVESSKVAGKMVATFDEKTFVKGKFDIVRCCRNSETGYDEVCSE